MTLAAVHGRPGAVLALGVIAAHLLVIDHLRLRDVPTPRPAAARSLWVHTVPTTAPPGDMPSAIDRGQAHGLRPATGAAGAKAAQPPGDRTPADPGATTQVTPGATQGATPGTGQAPPHEASSAQAEASTAPVRIAPAMHLRYAVSGQTRGEAASGQAELAWTHDGQRFEARFAQAGDGLPRRTEHSAGRLTPQGLAPERYAQRTRHEEAVHFERAAGHAVFSANRPAASLVPGAQDRLSLLLQLGARIAARPQAYPAGARFEVQTATTRDALIWRFRVEGHEELLLPGGHLSTLRLVRLPLGEFEPEMTLWLAPALDYAPVRLRLTHRTGDHLDYQWSGTDRR